MIDEQTAMCTLLKGPLNFQQPKNEKVLKEIFDHLELYPWKMALLLNDPSFTTRLSDMNAHSHAKCVDLGTKWKNLNSQI
ncbi:MAG: hypothetical protein HWD61_06950 [Parachlamydiaceae bacterium]|nr:MAG: hypothetical protein HWD61_06950 [Parachlamydiaceae bacterium]